MELAKLWRGDGAVEALATKIRKISGFGGKGFRMKEIVLDLAEVTKRQNPEIEQQLIDFGVVGPGPRRTLNWVNNRRWFDNEYDRSPAAEVMYVKELRDFKSFLVSSTDIAAELRDLNLLGVQFALCEASKYLFYLRYESGALYKPASRDFELILNDIREADAIRLKAIWLYLERDESEDEAAVPEDELHPDHRVLA